MSGRTRYNIIEGGILLSKLYRVVKILRTPPKRLYNNT